VLAQLTNLGTPYVVRAALLLVTFVVAARSMRDIGFTPKTRGSVRGEMAGIVRASLRHGLLDRRVRWVMLAGPFTAGATVYGFYAAQPYLLQLYGHTGSYAIAGLSAGLACVVQTGRLTAASPQVDPNLMLSVIAAVLIGGTAFTGGDGGLLGTVIGVLFLGIVQNGLQLSDVSTFWQGTVSGLILIFAVGIGVLRDRGAITRWRARRSQKSPALEERQATTEERA